MLTVRYFAYGSNLCTDRLRYRAPHCSLLGVAKLAHYTLRFHKRSKDGSGKCNAFFTGDVNDEVIGVVFEVPANEMDNIDRAEGPGYHQKDVSLPLPSWSVRAKMYVADPKAIDDTLQPYTWYKDCVLAGAEEHRLPGEYVEKYIRGVYAIPDPCSERERRERAKIKAAE